jgi:ubiquinone biosynthesis protein COQ4
MHRALVRVGAIEDQIVKDHAYFQQGISKVPTTSSTLVSSSRYLNHPVIRDWISTHFLRRNGPDLPVPADTTLGLVNALGEVRDPVNLQRLIDREKQINPRFAAWLDEAYIAPHTEDDFKKYPPETLGGKFYSYIIAHGYELNFGRPPIKPRNDQEFIFFRSGQTHDFEHLITGGQFNSLGELLPYFVRLSNPWRHLSPELAVELSTIYVFGGFRMVMRAALHYPNIWLTVIECMQRGFDIGLHSEPIFMAKFEDVLELTIAEARDALGVRNAQDFDTSAADAIFTEKV